MADQKQKCPMCNTKLKMINGRMTCKSCGYYYRNPNEQTDCNTAQFGAAGQSYTAANSYGSGQPNNNGSSQYNAQQQYSGAAGQYTARPQNNGAAKQYNSQPQYNGTAGQYTSRPQYNGAASGNTARKKKDEHNPAVRITGVIAAVVIGIVMSTFISLYNSGFFNKGYPFNAKDRTESIINSMGYGSSSSQEDHGLQDSQVSNENQNAAGNASAQNNGNSSEKRLPESEFFQLVAEAIWGKNYRTITAGEYASLTALQINREEKVISYQLNNGDTLSLTYQSDFGKKLSDLACFTGLEWLSIDDDLEKGDLDGLDNLYSVHTENSITELSSIIPHPENILELSAEDAIFSSTLEGIEAFSGLQSLYLDYWALEDISALSLLPNLRGLALADCDRLTDYSPLMELSGLELLSIESSQLKTIDFIREMPNLTYLSVENSMITNLHALESCPNIDTLYLEGNYFIEDYTGLETLENLTELSLELNYSDTMPSFENFGGLQRLTLKYANDLSVLANAPDVTYLCLEDCTSQGLEAITSMQDLVSLEIHSFSYYTESLEPLTRLPRLEALDLEDTYIYGNINEIFRIPTLAYLNLSGCRGVIDFNALPVNDNLQCLLLEDVSLADADTYDEWGGWESVKLSDHYDFFSNFPNLTDLYLGSTEIDSIEFVKDLPHLQYLDITNNNITSLKPLEALSEFRVVWCAQNNILEKLPEDSNIMVITD